MKLPAITLIAGLAVASAHTVFTTLFINNVDQGDATCVRMPMTPSNATYPVNDLTAGDMACGYGGSQGVARVCPVSQGSTLSFQYRTYADASISGSIDSSHKGPCAVYMKSVTSAINNTAVGDGWFKIMELGYDNNTTQWCTDKLILTNGTFNATIPNNLAGGYYLVRSEILSLHQADKTPPNPQFYVGCAQIFLASTRTAAPSNTVAIPGFTNISDPSVLFNIYIPKWPYYPPGPPIYDNSSASTQVQPIERQAEGLLPKNVVAVNANWWGIELDSYTDEPGCWNASTNCFAQAAICYNTAPPTGSKGCHTWESKCMGIQTACNLDNFTGPPDKGKIITPVPYSAVAGSSPSGNIAIMASVTSSYSTSSGSTSFTYSLTFSSSQTNTASSFSVITATMVNIPSGNGLSLSAILAINLSTSTLSQGIPTGSLKSLPRTSTASSFSIGSLISSPLSSATATSITLSTYTSWGTHRPTTSAILATPVMSAKFTSSASSPDIVIVGPSTDGRCGQGFGVTCIGSIHGQCCSVHGWCGNDNDYCGFMNCQVEQGPCGINSTLAVTPNSARAPTAATRLPRVRKYRNARQHQI